MPNQSRNYDLLLGSKIRWTNMNTRTFTYISQTDKADGIEVLNRIHSLASHFSHANIILLCMPVVAVKLALSMYIQRTHTHTPIQRCVPRCTTTDALDYPTQLCHWVICILLNTLLHIYPLWYIPCTHICNNNRYNQKQAFTRAASM